MAETENIASKDAGTSTTLLTLGIGAIALAAPLLVAGKFYEGFSVGGFGVLLLFVKYKLGY